MLKNLKYSMQRAKSPKGFDQAKQLLISTARVVEKCLKLLTPRQQSTPNPAPTAKWSLGRIEDHIVMNFICGNCGKRSELNYKYCPKCGARMIKMIKDGERR